MGALDMSLGMAFALSFIITWVIGLTPPILLRFFVLRRPIGKWWALGIVIFLCLVNLLIFIALWSTSSGQAVLIVIALVSYFILRKRDKKNPPDIMQHNPDR
jgi:drug/metabolite transporter (DMT)-like permease